MRVKPFRCPFWQYDVVNLKILQYRIYYDTRHSDKVAFHSNGKSLDNATLAGPTCSLAALCACVRHDRALGEAAHICDWRDSFDRVTSCQGIVSGLVEHTIRYADC